MTSTTPCIQESNKVSQLINMFENKRTSSSSNKQVLRGKKSSRNCNNISSLIQKLEEKKSRCADVPFQETNENDTYYSAITPPYVNESSKSKEIVEESCKTNTNTEQQSVVIIQYPSFPQDVDEEAYDNDITPEEEEVIEIQASKDVFTSIDIELSVISSSDCHVLQKYNLSSSYSVDSLATTCTDDSDDSTDCSENHLPSNELLFSVLHSLELEKEEPDSIENNLLVQNLIEKEKEYNDYRIFLTLLQTNF